jgi:integrase
MAIRTPIGPTWDVVERALRYTEQEGKWLWNLYIRLASSGGLRYAEISRLMWRDLILFEEKRVYSSFYIQVAKKSHKVSREVYIDDDTAKVIMCAWNKAGRPEGNWVVFKPAQRSRRSHLYNTPYSNRAINEVLTKISKAIGVIEYDHMGDQFLTTHSLRKAAGNRIFSMIAERTGNIGYALEVVKNELFQHTNMSHTIRYLGHRGALKNVQKDVFSGYQVGKITLPNDIPQDLISKRKVRKK